MMTFRSDDGDKDKFNHSLHYLPSLKFDQSLHYIAPLKTPILPEQKYYKTKHLKCNSLYFNGINDYINCSSINSGDTITLSVNVKTSDNAPNVGIFMQGAYGWTTTGISLMIRGGQLRTQGRLLDGTYFGSNMNTPTGEWQTMVITYDKNGGSNNVNSYLDGVLILAETTPVSSLVSPTANRYIGSWGLNASAFFNGFIDQPRIYNRVITPTEVLRLHQNKSISHTGLVLDLSMTSDYNSKTIIKDESGNDNDGTIHGCTWNCKWIKEKHKVI